MHIIQEAATCDLPALEQLYRESVTGAPWLPQTVCVGKSFADVSPGEVVYLVKALSGELCGFVSVYAPESFIHHLYVAPEFQRRGLASALLASLHESLPLPWRLKCTQANTNALAFYVAKGWQKVSAGDGEDGEFFVLEFHQEPNCSIERTPSSRLRRLAVAAQFKR